MHFCACCSQDWKAMASHAALDEEDETSSTSSKAFYVIEGASYTSCEGIAESESHCSC